MSVKVHRFVLFLLCLTVFLIPASVFSAKASTISQEKIVRVIKEVAFTAKDIPDTAFKAALDSMKNTKPWQKLIEMGRRIEDFEALCNTPLPNLDNVNEFRAFKQLVREKLNPMNWLKDIISPKWVNFMSDVRDVFSATKVDILERALRESQYQTYKMYRDDGYDSITAYDMATVSGSRGYYIIRSSDQYKNLSESQVNEMLRKGLEERYQAEKYVQFINELRENKQKYIKNIVSQYSEHVSLLIDKAREIADKTVVNLTGTWEVMFNEKFNGIMTLSHLDYTTAIGDIEIPPGKIHVDAYIKNNEIELVFHFRSFNVIDYYLEYPELSNLVVSQGGAIMTAYLKVEDSRDYYSGELYSWLVMYSDSNGVVLKKIYHGIRGEPKIKPGSIYISRKR